MPRYSMARALKFIDRVIDVPLFGHVGEPFESDDVVRVKSVEQYVKSMQSSAWDKVCNNALNHRFARIIDVYGMDWFQKQDDENVEKIWEEMDKRNLERTLKRVWKRAGIPEDVDPFIDTIQWAYNFITGVACDHALGFTTKDSFNRRYIEPWLLAGHLPCGWSGKVPSEPNTPAGVPPYADRSLADAIGNGKLKVY